MIIKFMSNEDLADSCSAKRFRLIDGVRGVSFDRDSNGIPHAYIEFRDGTNTVWASDGNVYVMDDTGKTIETFSYHPINPSPVA